MFDWLKKKPSEPPPLPRNVLSQTLGPDPTANPTWRELRERGYDANFGKCDQVFHEVIPVIPHVDVFIYPRSERRPTVTLITSGMSDRAMPGTADQPEYARAELIFYCRELRNEYLKLLQKFAHYPHDLNVSVGWCSTLEIGDASKVFFGNDRFSTLLLMPTLVTPDHEMAESILIDGSPLCLLWVIPITAEETQFTLESGVKAFMAEFVKRAPSLAFDANRISCV